MIDLVFTNFGRLDKISMIESFVNVTCSGCENHDKRSIAGVFEAETLSKKKRE